MKPGDIIRMKQSHEPYFMTGDIARLVKQDSDGDWWADFSGMGNDAVHYDGFWDVDGFDFEVIDE